MTPQVKTTVGLVLAFVGGAAAGSVATYLVAQKKLEAEYEVRLDEELQASMEFLVKQTGIGNMIVTNDDPEKVVPDEEFEEIEEVVEEPEGKRIVEEKPPLEEIAARNQKTNYNAISTPEDFTSGPEEEILPEEPVYHNPDISVISRDIFEENPSGFEQTTLTYFFDGGVLDIQGDYVVDPGNLIGEGKPAFGQMSDDANVVFLRNKKLEKEYEVIYDAGNAADFVNAGNDGEELTHGLQSLAERYRPEYRR